MREGGGRTVRVGDLELRAHEVWRGRGGHGLLYFRPADDGEGRRREADRRALLAPDERLADLPEEHLRDLYERAAPLTVTERRFRAPDGRAWLAQSVGPVWSEGGAAAGVGLLFTSLEGPRERFSAPDGHAGTAEPAALAAAWTRGRPIAGG